MMDPYELIVTRKMVGKVKPDPPDKAAIAKLLEAAVTAPNHHLTQPWRFIVLSGGALDDLGEVMAQTARAQNAGAADVEEKAAFQRARPKRAPVIITVIYTPSSNPKAVEVEDRYAIGAAVQNILLAASATGLGAYWRTGPAAEDPAVHRFLELGPGEEVAGFVYVGYPQDPGRPKPTQRTPALKRTTWKPQL